MLNLDRFSQMSATKKQHNHGDIKYIMEDQLCLRSLLEEKETSNITITKLFERNAIETRLRDRTVFYPITRFLPGTPSLILCFTY